MSQLFRRLIAMLAACVIVSSPAQARYIVLGHVDLSFYEVTAALVQQVLERAGYNVAVKKGSPSQIYPLLGAGEVDLFVAAWLPHTHAQYWEEYKDNVFRLTRLYDDAKLFWAVPDYIPASEVKAVTDLKKPQIAEKMEKVIRGPGADSGLMIGSKKIFEHYRLDQAGYELAPGRTAEWIAAFNQNIAGKKWFVMPLWQPQYLNRAASLRILEEPGNLLGGADSAYLVASNEARAKLDKYTFGVLAKLELSVKWVTELDYMVNVDKMSPHDAARVWIASHPETVRYWLEPDE
ncbi:MAG: glycine betaine ABC transporter substrate-binding protein [Burkholderiales bacterium]